MTVTLNPLVLQSKYGLKPKQALAVLAVGENGRDGKKPKSLGKIMKSIGYSPTVQAHPREKVLDRPLVKAALVDIVAGLDSVANKITGALDKVDFDTREPEKNAYVLDKVIKNRQLLSGGATENAAIKISWGE